MSERDLQTQLSQAGDRVVDAVRHDAQPPTRTWLDDRVGQRRTRRRGRLAVVAGVAVVAFFLAAGPVLDLDDEAAVPVVATSPDDVESSLPEPTTAPDDGAAPGGPTILFDANGDVLFEFGPDTTTQHVVETGTDGFETVTTNSEVIADGDSTVQRSWEVLTGLDDYTDMQFNRWLETNESALFGYWPATFPSDLRIYTTFDPAAEAIAKTVGESSVPETSVGSAAALVAIDPTTGAVRAARSAVPGLDEAAPGYDDVQAARTGYSFALTPSGMQPGTAFMLVVLTTALEQGVLPTDEYDGRGPCEFADDFAEGGVYTVSNLDDDPGRLDSIAGLLTRSSACGAVRIGQDIGLAEIADVADRLGLQLENYCGEVSALPLGVCEVTPLELATAQATLTNGGVRNDPYVIERIESVDGEVLYQHADRPFVAIDADVACRTIEALTGGASEAVEQGSTLDAQGVAGQRGLTASSLDSWFVGSTPYLATSVWIGSADASRTSDMRPEPGLADPVDAWRDFNEAFHADLPPLDFDC